MVNQIPDEGICPEEHGDEGSLFPPDKEFLSRATIGSRGTGGEGHRFVAQTLLSVLSQAPNTFFAINNLQDAPRTTPFFCYSCILVGGCRGSNPPTWKPYNPC